MELVVVHGANKSVGHYFGMESNVSASYKLRYGTCSSSNSLLSSAPTFSPCTFQFDVETFVVSCFTMLHVSIYLLPHWTETKACSLRASC